MDSKEGSEERNTHDLNRAEGIKTKLERRKRRLDDYLLSKRILPNLPTEAFIEPEQQYKAPEALEDKTKKKEEPSEQKGKLNLSNHRNKSRKSKKRCWICKSPNHFKNNCPKIKCFHCHKLGHMKKHCYKRKVDFIFNWLWEMDQKYREALKKRYIEKEEICRKFRESKYIKEGSVYKMYNKDTEVGVYIGPGTPKQFKAFNEIQPRSTDKKFVEACVRKATPIEKLKLFNGFTNWCGCGKINMGKREFIHHIYNIHNGIALPSSFINRPPWVDYIHFHTEEAEMYYMGINPEEAYMIE